MRIGPADTAAPGAIVVAEVGNNHEGDAAVARELIERIADAGAHAVKLQAFAARRFVAAAETARIAQLERFELTPDEYAGLFDLARGLGLGVACTFLDLETMDLLAEQVDAVKIASGDNDNPAFLRRAAETGKPVVVSTGMSDLDLVRRAVAVVDEAGGDEPVGERAAVLHCVSAYPAPDEDARLASIPALAAELPVPVGYSDHTLGLEACVAAVALGAPIVEKHVTLRHDFSDFRDHQLSAEPEELRELVERLTRVGAMLGTPRDGVLGVEQAILPAARRSVCAVRDLPAGQPVQEGDLTWLRPGGALAPGHEADVVGRVLRRAVAAGEPLHPGDVE